MMFQKTTDAHNRIEVGGSSSGITYFFVSSFASLWKGVDSEGGIWDWSFRMEGVGAIAQAD